MTMPTPVSFVETDIEKLGGHAGRVAIVVDETGKLDVAGRRVNRLTKGALKRAVDAKVKDKLKPGKTFTLAYPSGMEADAIDVLCVPRSASIDKARAAGAAVGRERGKANLLLAVGNSKWAAQIALGVVLRDYQFNDHKSSADASEGAVEVMCSDPAKMTGEFAPLAAVAEGTFFTRDLVNEPANVLTTSTFAERLVEMQSLGLKVEVLEEEQLAELGMRTLLAVGQGSASPSKVVVMQWNGGLGHGRHDHGHGRRRNRGGRHANACAPQGECQCGRHCRSRGKHAIRHRDPPWRCREIHERRHGRDP